MLLSWVLENNLTTKMLLTHAFAWFILCCYCAYFCYVTQTMHTISHFRVSFIALIFFISRLSLHQSGPVTDWVRMAHPNIHSSQFFGPEFFVNWLPFNFVPESPRLNYSEAIVNFGRPSELHYCIAMHQHNEFLDLASPHQSIMLSVTLSGRQASFQMKKFHF